MFGIPYLYYPSNSTLTPRCFLGFNYLLYSGSPYSFDDGYVSLNTTTNPISQVGVDVNYLRYDPMVGYHVDPQPY